MGYEAELLSQINMNCKEFPPYAPLSDYNVFHILGISAKEVIMCRFLADLLNPDRVLQNRNILLFVFLAALERLYFP